MPSAQKQEPASDNGFKQQKSNVPMIEPCGAPYYNAPASEKILSLQTKNVLLKDRTQTTYYGCPQTETFRFFSRRTPWSKV